MELPIEIAMRDVADADSLERLIRQKADRLSKFYDHISSCRVAVERVRRRTGAGDPHRVRIDITVPRGNELVVVEKPEAGSREEPQVLVRRAFDVAERRLKELKERQRYEVKRHEPPSGLVVRLFPEQDYGFLRTPEGREIYFHRNSVLHSGFDRLEIGTRVRFEEEEGIQGPQASTVSILDKPGTTHPDARPPGAGPAESSEPT